MKRIVFLFALTICVSTFAQRSSRKALEQQRMETLREISNTNRLLQDTKRTTSTLLNRVKLISSQIFSRQKVLSLLEQEVNGISFEQKKIENDILSLESELKDKQKSYAKAIDAMQQNRQSENNILFVLSGKSFTESYRRMRYLRQYSEWRSSQADEIKNKSNKLKAEKLALAKIKVEKITLMNLRESEQQNLKLEEENYQQEVNETQQKQKELQKILQQKRQQAEALDRQIAKLIAEEVARQERAAKRKAQERAKAEASKLKKNETKTSKSTEPKAIAAKPPVSEAEDSPLSSNFASNKGRLPYPISGSSRITSRFGAHHHNKWDVTTSSNGIDIQSQAGAEAKAVFDGEVSYVAAIPGYNTCIIIRHGSYYTFYGNIQSIYIKQGSKVKAGQSLGKVYTDPDTGLSQIHFQLWQGTSKMNPEPWLR